MSDWKAFILDLSQQLAQRLAALVARIYGEQGTFHRKLAVALTLLGLSLGGIGSIQLLFILSPVGTMVLLAFWSIAAVTFALGYTFLIPHGGMAFPASFVRTLQRAKQGEVEAILQLAAHYRRGGQGFPRSPGESVWWLTGAAEGGSPEAAFELAGHFERGEGAPRNARMALVWYERAAKAGHTEAERCVNRFHATFRDRTGDAS